MVSAARSQNRTTLGSTTTRGTRREPLVESCGPIRANSRESLFCAILSSGRVRHAATHRSATSAPIRMGGNIFDQLEPQRCGTDRYEAPPNMPLKLPGARGEELRSLACGLDRRLSYLAPTCTAPAA